MGKIIFAQLLDHVPRRLFKDQSSRLDNVNGNQKLSPWEQFVCMSFAQITSCDGLRSIETCLKAMSNKVYHLGLHSKVSRSSLARANEKRSSQIFKKLCENLISIAKDEYKDDKFLDTIEEAVYILDSTYISLCLSIFPWAQLGNHNKAVMKVHTLMDLKGSIPTFIKVSNARYPDNKVLDLIQIEPGAFYVMDKAYVDFKRLNSIDEKKGYFIVRFKKNITFKSISSKKVKPNCGVILDQSGKLSGGIGKRYYLGKVRKITFHDQDMDRTFIFMTNNFSIPAHNIAALYKKRWHIEIFFKWIKQNLEIKKFYGYSQNAVETQIWIAISTYLIVAIVKKRLKLEQPLHQILHFISISLFEDIPLFQILNFQQNQQNTNDNSNQLNLFN